MIDKETMVLLLILVPLAAGLLVLAGRGSLSRLAPWLTLLAVVVNTAIAISLFGQQVSWTHGWAGFGMDFSLKLYHFSSFIILASAGFGLLVGLYCISFMKGRPHQNQFYSYLLLSLAFTNGAVLADNMVVMLFFWEGLLLPLFGMIAIGRPGAFKTAIKALIIVGVTDLCLMMGIALTYWLSGGTLNMSQIHLVPGGWGFLAMILLIIGAISKAGSMPFHSWIPDAAVDAPLPFMAILPASLEKLLGIYLLARITLDLYMLKPDMWMSPALMIVGAATILLAVMMALVQKDYKRLLSYHAISQVGYMVLGIGTALPIGIAGGIFHMINHAMYKSCLFLTGGSVERQTGTTDLEKLGGIGRKMPITFTCFIIAAASISGFPLTNGFYSKELVYTAALQRNVVFYMAAILGTFFTAASFLKLGHAAYLGKRSSANDNVKEAPAAMLVPMIVIAAGCLLFGLYNALPLENLVQPVLGKRLHESLAGLLPHSPEGWMLTALTCVALLGALLNHLAGVKMTGSGIRAVDHIHHAPVLAQIYQKAERRFFDPYDIGLAIVGGISRVGWWVDRAIDWVYDGAAVTIGSALALAVGKAHTGSYPMYVLWSLIATLAIIIFLISR